MVWEYGRSWQDANWFQATISLYLGWCFGIGWSVAVPMTYSPSRIPSLPLSCFKEGKGFSNLSMYKKSAHIDQKRQSLKTQKILKKTIQISPGRTKVEKNTTNKKSSSMNHGMQSLKSSKTLQISWENHKARKISPSPSTSRKQYSL